MNDKCCDTCDNIHHPTRCPLFLSLRDGTRWDRCANFCNEYTEKREPGKIEPLEIFISCSNDSEAITEIASKVNEIIAAHNGRDGK